MADQSAGLLSVCTGLLSAHVRSMVESLIQLLKPNARLLTRLQAADCHLLFFDRIADAENYLAHCPIPHPSVVYVRGFEAYTHAFCAEHVLDRPLRPSAMAKVLDHAATRTRASAPGSDLPAMSEPALPSDADALLESLGAVAASGQRVVAECSDRRRWLIDLAQRSVTGEVVEITHPPVERTWSLHPAESWSGELGPVVALELWLYWLAKGCRGTQLLRFDDATRLQLGRAAIAAMAGREFVRLTVIFQRGASVHEACAVTGLLPGVVRSFLNVNSLLDNLRALTPTVAVTPVTTAAPAPAARVQSIPSERRPAAPQPKGLFARLLSRLFAPHDR